MGWDLSCRDWAERIRNGRSLVPTLPLNLVEGDRAVAIFDKLRLHDVAGTPTMAEAGGDWFRQILRALFGSIDPLTKQRMIRELFLLVPKKNAKTSQGALLMLTALLLNKRPNAPFILTAPVQDTAEMAFNSISGAISLDDVLSKKLHVREHLKTVIHRETHAELQIMTFDPSVLTGRKCAGVLVDELHVVARSPRAASSIRQLRGGMLPYPEAFIAFITTQSEQAPAGVFKAELMKARAIRDGEQEGAMLPVLYEFPIDVQKSKDQWRDPDNWYMVTPNAGRSVSIERLVEDMRDAEQKSEEELRAWASQHLDIEIGVSIGSDSWAGAEYWEQQGAKHVTLDYLLEHSEVIEIGLDGGGLDDLFGFAAIGRDGESGEWLHWAHAWAHPSVLERRKSEAARFMDFEAAGELTIVKQMGDDVDQIVDRVMEIEETGLLDRIGVDPVGIGSIVQEMTDRGIELERIVGVSQGWKMTGAIKTLERKLADGTFWHGDTGLMAYCVGNAKVEPRGNAVIITKQAAGSAKIDPLSATFNAVSLMSLNPEARGNVDQFLADPIIVNYARR